MECVSSDALSLKGFSVYRSVFKTNLEQKTLIFGLRDSFEIAGKALEIHFLNVHLKRFSVLS